MPARSSTGSASARLSLAIGALQVMLDRGEQLDWFGSGEIRIEAIVAASAFYLFLVHTFTADEPFVRPALFRDRNFAAGTLFIFVVGVTLSRLAGAAHALSSEPHELPDRHRRPGAWDRAASARWPP